MGPLPLRCECMIDKAGKYPRPNGIRPKPDEGSIAQRLNGRPVGDTRPIPPPAATGEVYFETGLM